MPASPLLDRPAFGSHSVHERLRVGGREFAGGVDATLSQLAGGDWSDTVNRFDVKRGEKLFDVSRTDNDEAVGFLVIGGDLGGAFGWSDADADRDPNSGFDLGFEPPCEGVDVCPGGRVGDVKIGFVDTDGFERVGIFLEEGVDVAANCLVVIHLDREIVPGVSWIRSRWIVGVGINASREPVERIADRHGGFDAVLTGLVTGSRDGPVGIGLLIPHADDDRFVGEVGSAKPLTGSIETIAVNVQDDRRIGLRGSKIRDCRCTLPHG
jgi:hypothetical protein